MFIRPCIHSYRCFTRSLLRNYCSSVEQQLKETRAILEQYTGGSVDLKKDISAGIAMITLNQPSKRNALSGHMMLQFENAVNELENWKNGKGVIVHGAEHTFCAGGDFDFVGEILDPVIGGKMSQFMHEVHNRLLNLPLVSVALVQGSALGGGAETALSCDFRLMTPKAKFGFVQARLGVSPGWGGGTRLVHLLGRTKALEILLEAKTLSTQQCLAYGIADQVIRETDHAFADTLQWLQSRLCWNPEVVHAVKKTVIAGCHADIQTALSQEREAFNTVWGGPTQKAALDQLTTKS